MRDHSSHRVVTRREAVGNLLVHCNFNPKSEEVGLWDACGRVLAKDVVSKLTLPSKPTSRMDAIAVHFDDFQDGIPDTSSWQRGRDYEFCNTGIAMPDGYDTALVIEKVRIDEEAGTIKLLETVHERGEGTSPIGSVIKEGTPLAVKGTILTPALLGLFAQGAILEVPVVCKPKVAFIPTGNELVDPCANPPLGKNVDSNSVMICSKLVQWGAKPMRHAIVLDQREKIYAALKSAAETCDIIVINAGSSKGSDDWTIELLEEYGEVFNHETNQGPGRHCSCSLFDGKPVVGISGPPVGAEFTVDWFVKPLVDAFLGIGEQIPPVLYAHLTEDVNASPRPFSIVKRLHLFRNPDGYLMAQPLPMYSPILHDCAAADAFLVIPGKSHGYHAGDLVEVELRYPYTLLGVY